MGAGILHNHRARGYRPLAEGETQMQIGKTNKLEKVVSKDATRINERMRKLNKKMSNKQSKDVKDAIKEVALNLDNPASQIRIKLDLMECSYLIKAINHYQKNIDEIIDAHLEKTWSENKEMAEGADREKVSVIMKLGGVASMDCIRKQVERKVKKKGWFDDDED